VAIRPTVTSLEALIMPKVKSFLEERAAQLGKKKESTPEEGTDMIAEAIALGIAEAFKHPGFDAEAAVIVDTNAAVVTPVGNLGRVALQTAINVPTPNPNLSRPY